MACYQLSKPASGDTVAVMHTNMGDIKIKLFLAEVPRTVNNFIELAKDDKSLKLYQMFLLLQ